MVDSVRNQWETNARLYAELIADQGTPHHRMILNPCVETLLGDVKDKRMLDAGCGEGYLARYYASEGAYVTGVDISSNLIEIARSKSPDDQRLEYKVQDICQMDAIADETLDIVLCNLVILNVPCLRESLAEFSRVLLPGGILILSIVHPCFNFYGPGEWEMGEKDSSTNRRRGLFFKIDHYADERTYERYWRTQEGERFPEPITFYHRTIATYVHGITDSGFRIDVIEEPLPLSDDDFFEREKRIPFFLVFKATKI